MKLALIRRQFAAIGGAELYLQRLLKALVAAGHEPHLFAESWDEPVAGVTLRSVASAGSRAVRDLRFAEAVRAQLAVHSFDCVFSLERTLQQDVFRAGDGVHRVWLERRRQFASWWKRPFIGRGAFHRNLLALEAQTLHPANTRRVIVNSDMVRREIQAHFNFPSDRIHLVRNGVEVERFQSGQRAATRARFGVQPDEKLLLFVGSGWERKGLGFLLRVMEGLSRVRSVAASKDDSLPRQTVKLLVVGKGKSQAMPPNVIVAGAMRDVENALAAADLFTFLPIYEPSANVVAEALAAGLPVVTSAQNGASELITEGVNGSVVANPADPAAVFAAIRFWLDALHVRPVKTSGDLSLARNVAETVAVLELAAREKRG